MTPILLQESVERFDGGAAVPIRLAVGGEEGIVEDYDAAWCETLLDLPEEGVGVRSGPVFGDDALGDGLIAELHHVATRSQALVAVGRAENRVPMGSQRLRTATDLRAPSGGIEERKRGVVPRMVTDRVAAGSDSFNELCVLCGCLSNHEEGTLSVMFLEHLQDSRCTVGMRAVIEGHRHQRFRARSVGHGAERSHRDADEAPHERSRPGVLFHAGESLGVWSIRR